LGESNPDIGEQKRLSTVRSARKKNECRKALPQNRVVLFCFYKRAMLHEVVRMRQIPRKNSEVFNYRV